MEIQLKVVGQALLKCLSDMQAMEPERFPAKIGDLPVQWKLTVGVVGVQPQDLLCRANSPCVWLVEAHDSVAVRRIHAIEEEMHTYLRRCPDASMALCPIILVFQSPAILVDSADFPQIVSDWMFLPVTIWDLFMRVGCALKRKGLLAIQRKGETCSQRILSEREVQILRLAEIGLQNGQLAGRLFLSETTIKWHLRNIYTKLSVANRSGAVTRARELGLL